MKKSIKKGCQTNKLPIPTKSFIQKARDQDNSEEMYFSKYLGKKSEHILKRYSDSKDICSKKCEFKTGIQLKTDICSESGTEAEIIFPKYSKNDVVQFAHKLKSVFLINPIPAN